ncbi:hypothetical protein [Allochromatium warmingii]|nr:hypothetical protein [Allochromatium warmingii]
MSSEGSSEFAHARPYKGLNANTAPESAAPRRLSLVFVRGIIWSLIGMIYAPLFIGLLSLARGAELGSVSYVLAAALAGGAGAILYGARELALISTGVGAVSGLGLLILAPAQASLTNTVVIAALLAAVVGVTLSFPRRCTRHVPGKLVAGVVTGAFVGAVLAIAEPWHAHAFSTFAALAFLTSANGILYAGSVRGWIQLSRRIGMESHPCELIEGVTMAILGAIAAGSVWMVVSPLLGLEAAGFWQLASLTMHDEIPSAFLGGLLGGGLAGMLLELFRFPWVHDV